MAQPEQLNHAETISMPQGKGFIPTLSMPGTSILPLPTPETTPATSAYHLPHTVS